MTAIQFIRCGFYILTALIVLQGIVSIIFGDVDLDIDMDSDIDGDGSSVFSFKGILHFCWGVFAGAFYLACSGSFYTDWSDQKIILLQTVFPVLTGLLSFIFLTVIYKRILKLKHEPSDVIPDNNEQLNARICVIYDRTDENIYMADCEYVTDFGTSSWLLAQIFTEDLDKIKPGDNVQLRKFPNHEEYITLKSGETVKFYINLLNL